MKDGLQTLQAKRREKAAKPSGDESDSMIHVHVDELMPHIAHVYTVHCNI